MPSQHRRAKAHEDFRDAERQYRYYYGLYNHYSLWRRNLRLGLLLATSGTVVTAVQGSEIAALVLGLTTAGMMGLDHVQDYARKAAIAFSISESCAKLVEAYHDLWIRVEANEVEDDRLAEELRALAGEMGNVTSRSGYAELTEHRRLHEKGAAEANQLMTERKSVKQEVRIVEEH